MTKLSKYVKTFFFSATAGPLAIIAHEVLGHWLPAKILGSKKMSIGYRGVDIGTALDWSPVRRFPVEIGGPIVTNLLSCFGLFMQTRKPEFSKLIGWGLTLTLYRSIQTPLRQLIQEKEGSSIQMDESLAAKCLNVSKYTFSLPEAVVGIFLLVKGYRLLPENKIIIATVGFSGTIAGTIVYLKYLGPFLWSSQPKRSLTGNIQERSE